MTYAVLLDCSESMAIWHKEMLAMARACDVAWQIGVFGKEDRIITTSENLCCGGISSIYDSVCRLSKILINYNYVVIFSDLRDNSSCLYKKGDFIRNLLLTKHKYCILTPGDCDRIYAIAKITKICTTYDDVIAAIEKMREKVAVM